MRLTAREREIRAARAEIERNVAAAVSAELAILWRQIYPSVRRLDRQRPLHKSSFIGGATLWSRFQTALQERLTLEYMSGAVTLAMIQSAYNQIAAQEAAGSLDAASLVQARQSEIGQHVTNIAQTTREHVAGVVADWYNTPESTLGGLVNDLTPLFGPKRAASVATTETTWLNSAVVDGEMERLGIDEWYWNTARDEITCKLCRDRHGHVFKRTDPKPPEGSHPNCRCSPVPIVNIAKKPKPPIMQPAPVAAATPAMPIKINVAKYAYMAGNAHTALFTADEIAAAKTFYQNTWKGQTPAWIVAQEQGQLYVPPVKVQVVSKPKPKPVPAPVKPAPVQALTRDALKAVDLHTVHPSWKKPKGNVRYGAVLINDAGHVLLREPKKHFDGYAWTFAKGGPDFSGENPIDVAEREVLQETGYEMEIIGLVPGGHDSGYSTTYYFIARPKEHHPEKIDRDETENTFWFDPKTAAEMIAETTNSGGVKRDTSVLAAALDEYGKIQAGKAKYEHIIRAAKPKEPKKTKAAPVIQPRNLFAQQPSFPAAVSEVKAVQTLGGSTGAQLVEAADGTRYVMKRGNSPAHLLEEAATDAVYQAAGVNVPVFQVYQTDNGPVKLSAYVDKAISADKALAGAQAETVKEQLQRDFVVDALLGNWDVLGMQADNVLVDSGGHVHRIDNGGGLRYRGMGDEKHERWNPHPIEIFTMRDKERQADDPDVKDAQAQAVRVFGGMKYSEVGRQMREVAQKRDAILAAAPVEVRAVLAGRLDTMARLGRAQEQMQAAGWSERYQEGVGRQIVETRRAGITGKLPKTLKWSGKGDAIFTDENGQAFDHLRGKKSIMGDVKQCVTAAGGNYEFIKAWLANQSHSSYTNTPMAVKWMIAQENGGVDDYWFGEGYHFGSRSEALAKAQECYDYACRTYGGEEAIKKSLESYHAFVYELLENADLPNKNADGTLRLIRTESRSFIRDVAKIKRKGGKSSMRRGSAESTSLLFPVLNDHVTVTNVPLCDVLAVYMVESEPGNDSTCLWGDYENEFVTRLGRRQYTYACEVSEWNNGNYH